MQMLRIVCVTVVHVHDRQVKQAGLTVDSVNCDL